MSIYKDKCGETKLRVISGSARGKKLISTEGFGVRPTLDRVKESLFNMIAFDVPEASVLDLFCGSGALGIEALSRGAASCVFVDKSSDSIAVTKQNLSGTRLFDRATTVLVDSLEFLKTTGQTFDIIFVDPPYQAQLYGAVLQEIAKRQLLASDGIIILESAESDPPDIPASLFSQVREKKYGKVKIFLIKA